MILRNAPSFAVLVCCLAGAAWCAQPAASPPAAAAMAAPAWSCTFESDVLWQKVSPVGGLIVETKKGMYGVDVEKGTVLWSNPAVAGVDESVYKQLGTTPYFTLEVSKSLTVFDPTSGKSLFSLKESGLSSLEQSYTLYDCNGLVVTGKGKDKYSAVMVDMTTGKQVWKRDGLSRVISAAALNNRQLLLVTLFDLFCIESATGKDVWTAPTSAAAKQLNSLGAFGGMLKSLGNASTENSDFDVRFYLNSEKGVFVLGAELDGAAKKESGVSFSSGGKSRHTTYNLFNVSDGKMVWSVTPEFDGKFGQVLFLDQGIAVLPLGDGKSEVNMLSYQDGSRMWGEKKRGITIDGGVSQAFMVPEGLVVVTLDGKKAYVGLIKPETGTAVFKDPVKLRGQIALAQRVGPTLVVQMDKYLNVIDLATGKLKIAKGGLFGGDGLEVVPGAVAFKDNDCFAYCPKEKALVRIGTQDGTSAKVTQQPLVFGNDEMPKTIEVHNKGLLVSCNQSIAFVNYDGTVAFNVYLKGPKLSGWNQALLIAQGAHAAMVASVYATYSATGATLAVSSGNEKDRRVGSAVGAYGGAVAANAGSVAIASFKAAAARLSKTKETRDRTFIMTDIGPTIVLAVVEKKSGAVVNQIDLKRDRKPVYDVDDAMSKVYYKSGDKVVQGFAF